MVARLAVIVEERNFIYLSTPKVANTSIKSALLTLQGIGDASQPHSENQPIRTLPLSDVRSPNYSLFFKFGFVRNPWDRLLSTWADKCGENTDVDLSHYGLPPGISFSDFVINSCRLNDTYTEIHLRSQVHFLMHAGCFLADYIARFENIEAEWQRISSLILSKRDKRLQLPKMRRSTHSHYRDYYTPYLAQLVGQRYESDIKLFGYRYK